MPYKNKEEQKKYQREWVAKRRKEFFDRQVCKCGSKESLELHHKDPSQKVTNSIWSWSKAKREGELSKCEVLCRPCHLEETRKYLKENRKHGSKQLAIIERCKCESCDEYREYVSYNRIVRHLEKGT